MTLTPEERDEASHLPLPSCGNRSPFLESNPSPPAAVISRQALPAPGSQLHSNRVLWKGLETEFATVSPEGSGTISIDLSRFSIRARGRGHSHLSSSSPSPSGLVPRGGTVLTQPPPAAAFLSAPKKSWQGEGTEKGQRPEVRLNPLLLNLGCQSPWPPSQNPQLP